MSQENEIAFDDFCAFEVNPPSVVFAAFLNGDRSRCSISSSALEDQFGARGGSQEMLASFKANRVHIREIAKAKILAGEQPIILNSNFEQ